MAKNIILVAGSPGAGKTTVLKGAASPSATIINMGSAMLEVGKKQGYINDRDEIKFLDPKRFNELRNKALEAIEKMEGNIIIDTHASVGENGRYQPGLPLQFLEKLGHVKAIIYIDATTHDIMGRRKADSTRKRENDDAPAIDAQRLINISMLSFASAYLNIPLYMVINRQDDLKKTVAEVKEKIEEVVS